MTNTEAARIHKRIDEQTEAFHQLRTVVETNVALCQGCRTKVMGNGKEGIDERLARIEERAISDGARRMAAVEDTIIPNGRDRVKTLETTLGVSKWWLMMAISGAGALGAVVSAIIRLL